MDGRKIFGSTSSKSIMLSKLLVFFTETYFELLSAGSLHTPQSLMSRPRSWQSNGHSVSGRNKIVDWAPQNILIVNCWSLRSTHKWPGSDRQDGDDLFIRSADARQTSSLLLTPKTLWCSHTITSQFLVFTITVTSFLAGAGFYGVEKNNSGKIFLSLP